MNTEITLVAIIAVLFACWGGWSWWMWRKHINRVNIEVIAALKVIVRLMHEIRNDLRKRDE